MSKEQNEQIINVAGWHFWCDGDGVQKVDRAIRLGKAWHYHVIEDEEGEPADEWTADYENKSSDSLIFSTKELAIEDYKRQKEQHAIERKDREEKEDSEDAALVEKLSDMSVGRVGKIVKKAHKRFCVVWIEDVNIWKLYGLIIEILESGGIIFRENNNETFISLGSIERVIRDEGRTSVITKTGFSYHFQDENEYYALLRVLKIYSKL